MASLELEGRLVRKLDVQTGRSARGDWSKQEFIVEYQEGNFPSSVCFNVWGADKVRDLERFQPGDEIRISFNATSREFNGRWYTDLRAWRITPAGQAAQPAAYGPQAPAQTAAPAYGTAPAYGPAPRGAQDVPAGFGPSAPAPTLDDFTDAGSDDLPF